MTLLLLALAVIATYLLSVVIIGAMGFSLATTFPKPVRIKPPPKPPEHPTTLLMPVQPSAEGDEREC